MYTWTHVDYRPASVSVRAAVRVSAVASGWTVQRAPAYTFLRNLPQFPAEAQQRLGGLLSSDWLQSKATLPSLKTAAPEATGALPVSSRPGFWLWASERLALHRKEWSSLGDQWSHMSWGFSEQHHRCRQQLEAAQEGRMLGSVYSTRPEKSSWKGYEERESGSIPQRTGAALDS